jgi:hypothetical protein
MVDRSICARPCLAGCVDKNSSPLSGRESLPTVSYSFCGPKWVPSACARAGLYLRATKARTDTAGRQHNLSIVEGGHWDLSYQLSTATLTCKVESETGSCQTDLTGNCPQNTMNDFVDVDYDERE